MLQEGDEPVLFARIEELDPEPPAAPRRARRAELLLGLALLLGLVAFGLGEWMAQQARLSSYQAGARAAAALRWEAALSAYQAAAPYADAAARAVAAASTIAGRDTQYARATHAATAGDWAAALDAARRVQQVAPHYQAIDAVVQTALPHLLTAALRATVALRPAAQPPGLYSYPGRWTWLPDSDAASRVRAVCPDSSIVYDGPAPSGGRRLRRQAPERPDAAAPSLAYDPAASYSCTPAGVWAVAYRRAAAAAGVPRSGATSRARLGYFGSAVWAFEPFDGGPPVTATPPDPTWSILGGAPDGRHVLAVAAGGSLGGPDHLVVYLATPDGSAVDALGVLPGTVAAGGFGRGRAAPALFSPDGRFVLLTTTAAETTTVTLLDTAGGRPPAVLAAGRGVVGLGRGSAVLGLFLTSGTRAGQILVSWNDGAGRILDLLDPADPTHPIRRLRLAPDLTALRVLNEDDQGHLLLAGDSASFGRPHTVLLDLDQTGRIQETALSAQPVGLTRAWLRDGRLVALNTPATGGAFTLTATRLATAMLLPPATIFTGTSPAGRNGFWSAAGPATVRLSAAYLVYTTTSGALHARAYDGSADVLLDTGVTALYAADPGNGPADVP